MLSHQNCDIELELEISHNLPRIIDKNCANFSYLYSCGVRMKEVLLFRNNSWSDRSGRRRRPFRVVVTEFRLCGVTELRVAAVE